MTHHLASFETSVATALAGVFAISVNKICKIMEIFEQLDNLKIQGSSANIKQLDAPFLKYFIYQDSKYTS